MNDTDDAIHSYGKLGVTVPYRCITGFTISIQPLDSINKQNWEPFTLGNNE